MIFLLISNYKDLGTTCFTEEAGKREVFGTNLDWDKSILTKLSPCFSSISAINAEISPGVD